MDSDSMVDNEPAERVVRKSSSFDAAAGHRENASDVQRDRPGERRSIPIRSG